MTILSFMHSSRRPVRRVIVPSLILICACAARLAAHPNHIHDAEVRIEADGTWAVDLYYDVDALLAGVPPEQMWPEIFDELRKVPPDEMREGLDRIRKWFRRLIRIRFDEDHVDYEVEFPEMEGREVDDEGKVVLPGTLVRFSGAVPEGSKTFQFRGSRANGFIILTFPQPDGTDVVQQMLLPGEESPPYSFTLPEKVRPAGETAVRYLRAGFDHIIPVGLDHILFVLGLFLLDSRMRPLLWQVTAFTLAHSVTLGLSMTGRISVPGSIVEPLIALSIALIALENLVTRELKPWRPVVVFLFGMLHGLGFAGTLSQLGLPKANFGVALVTFNIGVELGQLAILAGGFVTVGWMREKEWYRRGVAIPLSLMIGIAGLYWFGQSAAGGLFRGF